MSASKEQGRSQKEWQPTPSVLLFDFGGTLDADGTSWKERFFRLFQEEGAGTSPDRFDTAFYAADDALVGALPADLGFRDTAVRLALGVAGELQIRNPALARRVGGRFVEEASERLAASAELFDRLSLRYRLGVISNFYGNLSAVCQETGIGQYLVAAVDSTAVGCSKPDPRIFQAALARLGAEPGDAVFVGDSLARDMAGARAVGMAHIWLAGEHGNGRGRVCCPKDRIIRRLTDLSGIFL